MTKGKVHVLPESGRTMTFLSFFQPLGRYDSTYYYSVIVQVMIIYIFKMSTINPLEKKTNGISISGDGTPSVLPIFLVSIFRTGGILEIKIGSFWTAAQLEPNLPKFGNSSRDPGTYFKLLSGLLSKMYQIIRQFEKAAHLAMA